MFLIYRLQAYTDCEGRGTRTSGLFLNKSDAECVHRSGFKNTLFREPSEEDLRVLLHPAKVYESLREFVDHNPDIGDRALEFLLDAPSLQEVTRQRALAKLTDAERKALGVG